MPAPACGWWASLHHCGLRRAFRARRFKHLLSRPTILRELTAERETLLAQLTALLDAMDGEYEAKARWVGVCGRVGEWVTVGAWVTVGGWRVVGQRA